MQDQRFGRQARQIDWTGGHPAVRPALSPREKYFKDWKLVKRARFNAAKRYERKHSASTIAFAIAGIVGFLVPFYSLLFRDVLAVHTKNVLDFTAFVIGALSLTLGLIEQARDYPDKARSFNLCGRRVNSVARRLTTSPTMHDDQLQELVTQYEAALEECADNHDDIDYEIAKAQEEIAETQGPAKRAAMRRLGRLRWLVVPNLSSAHRIHGSHA